MKPFLLGIPFENGIRMMQRLGRGTTGAADTPAALFRQLETSNIEKKLLDLAAYQINVTPENCHEPAAIRQDNILTLEAHEIISKEIEAIGRKGFFPVSIGGDHSITYPVVKGLCRAFPGKNFGLIYLDAHLDLRPLESHAGVSGLISSGNAFRRILEDRKVRIVGHRTVAIGIHESSSAVFGEMFQFAQKNGMKIFMDRECHLDNLPAIISNAVKIAGEGADAIYLSLDIDAVNAQDAPGVSAPAVEGLSRDVWLELIKGIAKKASLAGVDLVEASSRQEGWQRLSGNSRPTASSPQAFNQTLELLKQTLTLVLG